MTNTLLAISIALIAWALWMLRQANRKATPSEAAAVLAERARRTNKARTDTTTAQLKAEMQGRCVSTANG